MPNHFICPQLLLILYIKHSLSKLGKISKLFLLGRNINWICRRRAICLKWFNRRFAENWNHKLHG